MSKKILGLDLGTNSIGWALVNEAENDEEKSSITKIGVRVNPLTVDELGDFEKGKSITTNADKTLKHSMRRNLQRYKHRREHLIAILKEQGFISNETILSENGNHTTFETYRLRAKAATQKISLEEFARVLLMINKKRGYKSNRKAKGQDERQLIDGMEAAKRLYNENLTPAGLCLQLMQAGKKYLPDFYRSDLQAEFDKVWEKQKEFYPEILTDELKEKFIRYESKNGKKTERRANEGETWKICEKPFGIVGIKRDTKGEELKKENLLWRVKALSEKMDMESLAIILQKINSQINNSSDYLGAISDRSKELYFKNQTVGQYQMAVLDKNPNASLRNMVFYRQDYLDEFNTIWDKQAEHHKELTTELKNEIRDVVIFYQRRLKSQKGLINFCEFESRQIEVEIEGKMKTKTIGSRVIPRSSPLFQEFKIWQRLNDIEVFPANEKNKKRKLNARQLEQREKELLFEELSIREKLTKNQILTILDLQEFDMNFNSIDGNQTQYELFKAYKKIIESSEYEIGDSFSVEIIEEIFKHLGINTDILYFDYQKPLDEQPMYKLYHLLYSFEGDKSNTGIENLINKLKELYGFEKDYAKFLADVSFQSDYGSLSAKAIVKILPHLKAGEQYDVACVFAGYGKHSKSSLTKEELDKKVYTDKLKILPKNSLRNPVVEKILNQMVNVINTIIDTYGTKNENGKVVEKPFDEIRIELSRDLKKSVDERFLLTNSITANTDEVTKIKDNLKKDFPIFKNQEPSRNDIIRYKLWQELKPNAYKPLYGSKENLQKEISPAILFSKEIEIEHIIPKARLFDDSFSNKTLAFSFDNKNKTNMTAYDYVAQVEGDFENYINRIINVCGTKTVKKVITNKATKTKSIKKDTKTFDSLYKEYEKSLKKQIEKLDKWNKSTEVERKKLVKPWSLMSNVEKKIAVINKYYSGKLKKLVITESELPEGFINRDLANTQYITKKAKEMLGDLAKFVVSTTGSITERLREDWQLIDLMKELNRDKYDRLGLTEIIEKEDYDGNKIKISKIKDWTKRNDHRHHAMDALIVAFTKRQFIQYLNNLNARRTSGEQGISNTEKEEHNNFSITSEDIILNTRDVLGIEQNELYRDAKGKLRFNPPIPLNEFRAEARRHLENTLISIKAKNKVVTQNINTTKKSRGTNKKIQQTPRGRLHKESIYGIRKQYVVKEEKISTGFDKAKIMTVSKPVYRDALLKRLQQFDNEPKNAFGGKNTPAKNPIFIDETKTEQLPEKVKTVTFEIAYTIRKEISPDLKLDKVVDLGIKKILENRLKEYHNDAKTAFSNLDENPIWLNKEKDIPIKRVTIAESINDAKSLHDKRDKDGNLILDENGKKQRTDFVITSNNHHVAVYQKPVLNKTGEYVFDEQGNQQFTVEEKVVSFYEAVACRNEGLPVIDKEYNQSEDWKFLYSMKQNEYFVFPNEKTGFNPKEIDLLNPENYSLISPNLFRVQKFSFKNYVFRHHLETTVDFSSNLKGITWTDFRSSKGLDKIVKVRINHIGQIVSVGEY